MSRPAHLPPRYHYQKKSLPTSPDSTPQTIPRNDELSARHRRFPSQSSILEELPSWFDDLPSHSETSPHGILLQRSASDSVAILGGYSGFCSPASPTTGGNASSTGFPETEEPTEGDKTSTVFEAGYVYGPNSPRRKSRLTESESSMVSALLENVPQNPLQYLTLVPSPGCSNAGQSSVGRGAYDAAGVPNSEKAPNRHSGQRSRVRKLPYIAELERTVNVFQTLEAELAAGFTSLTQRHLELSVENKMLKWQIACLQKEKMVQDVQNQALKNEIERLKMIHGRHRRSRSTSGFEMGIVKADSGTSWQMLDMGKLSLGGSPVPTRHGLES